MGVRGLLTYALKEGYFVPHKLQSTLLIIDAGALVDVSVYYDCDRRLGGDYWKIYRAALKIFILLKECEITPIVVEDGHYKEEKADTIRERAEKCLQSAIEYKQKHYKTPQNSCVPTLHLLASRDALDILRICRCRAELDADEEIIELARKLNCPVVGNDSDFCLSNGVDFILYDSMDFETSGPFIKCLKFDREKFLEDHGVSSEVLPFLSVLFPSDYSKAALFYKIEGNVHPSLRYKLALKWLKGKTAEQIMDELLTLKPDNRSKEDFESEVNFAVNNYINCAATVIPVLEKHETIGPYVKNVQFNIQESNLIKKYNVPVYIADKIKSCQLGDLVLNFFVSDIFECSANTFEDIDQKSIYYPTIRLIQGLFGIVSKHIEKPSTTLVIRERQRFINVIMKPLIIKNKEDFKMLYEIMEINYNIHEDVQQLDESWTIFVLTIIYWRNKCREIVNPTHVYALLLSAFALHVRKFAGSKLLRNYSFPMNCFKELRKLDCGDFVDKKMESWEVSSQDNIVLKNILHIHVFITFQKCLIGVLEIFPLLNLPHKIRIGNFLSGEFYHSIYAELENKWNVIRYINTTQFFRSDRLKNLFYEIVSNKVIADLL